MENKSDINIPPAETPVRTAAEAVVENRTEKSFYTYIILTVDNTLYCGYTDDIEKRFEKHKAGLAAKYTRAHKALKIVYSRRFDTKSEAMKEECRIKTLTRAQKEALIESQA